MKASQESTRNIRDIMGVDYLLTPQAAASAALPDNPAQASSSLIEQAKQAKRMIQMKTVLDYVQTLPQETGQLYTVLDHVNMELPDLLAVASDLERAEYISVPNKERLGNWTIKLTPRGHQFLQIMNP